MEYGRWTVLEEAERSKHGQKKLKCRCECGTEKNVLEMSLKNGKSTSCGCYHRENCAERFRTLRFTGKNNGQWTGGRHKTKKGYVLIHAPDHPRAKTRPYVFEHIIVMEKSLGRYLFKGETVHHKNGIKDDNRLKNLELFVKIHPGGQRPKDLVVFAEMVLSRYAPDKLK